MPRVRTPLARVRTFRGRAVLVSRSSLGRVFTFIERTKHRGNGVIVVRAIRKSRIERRGERDRKVYARRG